MEKTSAAMQKPNVKEFDKLCFCPRCPTHIGTGESKRTFCIIGKSKIIKEEKGCLCPACPVQRQLGFKWTYYCMRGSAKERSGMK